MLGRRAGLRMLAEKGCDPSGDVDAFMIVLERVKGMIHPVFSHSFAPCFHQRRGVVRGECGVPCMQNTLSPIWNIALVQNEVLPISVASCGTATTWS